MDVVLFPELVGGKCDDRQTRGRRKEGREGGREAGRESKNVSEKDRSGEEAEDAVDRS